MTASQPWFNTIDYAPWQLALFALGCFGWVVAYMGVLQMILRRGFVEIPAMAVVANIAWEFVWGFFYGNSLGLFFAWGYRLWFFMDLFILYSLLRYGAKQVETPELRRYFRPAVLAGVVAWALAIYFFVGAGYDTGFGAVSGYILNVMMSFLYISLLLRHPVEYFSAAVAWSKMLGTGILTVWNLTLPELNALVLTLGVVTLALDLIYIRAYYARAEAAAAAPVRVAAG